MLRRRIVRPRKLVSRLPLRRTRASMTRRQPTRTRPTVRFIQRKPRPMSIQSSKLPKQSQFLGRVNFYRRIGVLLPGIVPHTSIRQTLHQQTKHPQTQLKRYIEPIKPIPKPINQAPEPTKYKLEPITMKHPWESVGVRLTRPLMPVHEKVDLFDKHLRFHVGEIVYNMMGGNQNVKWTTQTNWPIPLQPQFDINNQKEAWEKMVSESIPFAFIIDPNLAISPADIDRFHYLFYELDRLQSTGEILSTAYDIIYIHYTHVRPPKKSFPGLAISIPSEIDNVRSYALTLQGAQKLLANGDNSNVLQIPDLNVFTFRLE